MEFGDSISGRIRRKRRKTSSFEYVGQKQTNRTRHSDGGKRWIASGVPIPIPRRWGALLAQNPHAEAIIDLGVCTARDFRLAKSGCCQPSCASDYSGRRGTLGVKQLSSRATGNVLCKSSLWREKSKVVLSDGTVVWLNAGSAERVFSSSLIPPIAESELNSERIGWNANKRSGATFIVQATWIWRRCERNNKVRRIHLWWRPFISTTLLEKGSSQNWITKASRIRMSPGEGKSMRLNIETGKFIRTPSKRFYTIKSVGREPYRAESTLHWRELVFQNYPDKQLWIFMESGSCRDQDIPYSLRNRETIGGWLTTLQRDYPDFPSDIKRQGTPLLMSENNFIS